MPVIRVEQCLQEFESTLQKVLLFVDESASYRKILPNGTYRSVGGRRVELFAGLALLNIYLAWEDFLETVFLRYMCGAVCSIRFAPSLIKPPKRTIAKAFASLVDPGQTYLTWQPQKVISRSTRYFRAGEPFSTSIGAITQTLEDIIIVRNRFAHRSDSSRKRFRKLIIRTLGYVPRGISPGRFLLRQHPDPNAGGVKFIKFYANSLVGAGRSIVR